MVTIAVKAISGMHLAWFSSHGLKNTITKLTNKFFVDIIAIYSILCVEDKLDTFSSLVANDASKTKLNSA